jgi:hypothetical protein
MPPKGVNSRDGLFPLGSCGPGCREQQGENLTGARALLHRRELLDTTALIGACPQHLSLKANVTSAPSGPSTHHRDDEDRQSEALQAASKAALVRPDGDSDGADDDLLSGPGGQRFYEFCRLLPATLPSAVIGIGPFQLSY